MTASTTLDLTAWERDGYCFVPGLFSPAKMDEVVEIARNAWQSRDPRVLVDNQIYDPAEPRIREYADRLSEADRGRRFVLNDMHLSFEQIRAVCLDAELVGVLRQLMGKQPVLTQSLNFNWGTNQGLHQDTLYLPPPNETDMLAIWVALEDIHPDSGPLRYLPGSHKIPPFRFSTGKVRFVPDEVPDWDRYIARHIEEWDLQEHIVEARKGDVFVWHGYLMHGGSDIADRNRTRKTLVCHYYALDDMESAGARCDAEFGGHWVNRPQQMPR